MFGTIGRGTIRAGQEGALRELLADWKREIRPLVPGAFLELNGHQAADPREMVVVALARDEAAYRHLAALPEQHAWYLRLVGCLESPPTWEDVRLDIGIND